jgi:hypothetical protein
MSAGFYAPGIGASVMGSPHWWLTERMRIA